MIPIASGLSYLDLDFLGLPRIIATAVLHGSGGAALIDPGPSTALPALTRGLDRAGISMADVRALLLTHIHLDHAGSTGTLVAAYPHLRVYVHEKGAPHLADPAKLVASAARLYGDDMDRLWGEVRAVPRAAMTALAGGERIEGGGCALDVAYTPGHASHHVCYFNRESGVAFVGDTAGVRLHEPGVVLPPTPPPDIDLEAWSGSLSRIDAWRAGTLFVTHFGPYAPVGPHLSELTDHLALARDLAKRSLEREGSDESREAWFVEQIRLMLRARMSAADAEAYEVAGRFDLSWRGLARYLRKRS